MQTMVKQPWKWNSGRALWRWSFGLVLTLFLTLQLWLTASPTAQATGVYSLPNSPPDANWVIDQAGALSRVTRSEINSELEKLAEQTGKQVRFVTIHRLDYGETVDSFAEQLFKKWFPTVESQAGQVLLVLDNVTNTTTIKTSSDIKDLLTDEIAQSVAQETVMVPLRQDNKYNQAFLDASDRLVAVLSGQPDPGPPLVEDAVQTEGTFARAEETDDRSATIVVVVLLVLATVIPMATYYFYQMQS
jgi:uncharacterized protein